MNKMNHPNIFVLKSFASGEIGAQLAILVSAHLESCVQCKIDLHKIESEFTKSFISESKIDSQSFEEEFKSILNCSQEKLDISSESNSQKSFLNFEGKNYHLPKGINSLQNVMGPWKMKLKNFYYSKLNLSGIGNMYFLYFKSGVSIPVHTHTGNEYVYVIAGSFEDGINEYITGDFANFNQSVSHSPRTNDPDGCMLLVSIEAPFHFQKGWARLLNLFGKWIY